MGTDLRRIGISAVEDSPWGTHFCHFYETKQDLLDTLVPFVKAGLEDKEFCLWVISEPRTEKEARSALKQAVPDLDRYLADRSIEFLPHDEWYLKGGAFDLYRVISGWKEKLGQALARGYAGMRVTGNTAWIQQRDWRDFREYEKELDVTVANQRMIVLCTFPLAASGAAELLDVARTHQVAVARRNGNWEILETPVIKQAKEEIKRLNEGLEQQVLERTKELAAANEDLRKEIAERKLAEEALRVSETRFRRYFELGLIGMAITSPTKSIIEVNDQICEILGHPRSELLEMTWAELTHPEDLAADVDNFNRVLAGEIEGYSMDKRFIRKDGQIIHATIAVKCLRRADGSVDCFVALLQDITERKRTEEHFRFQARALSQVNDALIAVDNEYRITYGNAGAERLYGFKSGEVLGRRLEEVIQYGWFKPEDEPAAFDALSASGWWSGQNIQTQKDGGKIHVESSVSVLKDEGGHRVGLLGVIRDITERQRLYNVLQESEERFRSFMTHLPGFAWIKDAEGRYVFMNTRLQNILQKHQDDWMGRTDDGLWPSEIAAEYKANDQRVLREGRELQIVETWTWKGNVGYVLANKFPIFDAQGTPILVGGASIDITERKRAEEALRESEERFRQLAENIREVFWMNTADFKRMLYVSPAYEHIWGRSPESLYRDRGYRIDSVHPQDRSRVLAVEQTQDQPFEVEYRIVRPDGSVRWIRDRGFPIKDPSGKVYRFAGIAEDITERKTAEEALVATTEQLRALSGSLQLAREEERTRIARELHDELGSALTSLSWDLQGVDKMLSAAGRKAGALRKKITSMTRLVDATIDTVRRIASELRPGILDDLGLMAAIEWHVEQLEAHSGITCQCDFPAENIDLSRKQTIALFRIFQEAMTNILRHAQATRVNIRIEEKEGQFVLQVSDNGRGITEEEKTGSRSLGLIGIRERAHLIGGKIKIDGVAGKGTVLTVQVPLGNRVSD
jgi:PAS domain S-box-containing protein